MSGIYQNQNRNLKLGTLLDEVNLSIYSVEDTHLIGLQRFFN